MTRAVKKLHCQNKRTAYFFENGENHGVH